MSLLHGVGSGLGGAGDSGGALGSFYSHTIDQSIRVERGDPGRLQVSFSGDGDSQALGTFSWWMKRTELGRSQSHVYFEQSGYGGIQFRSDKLAVNSFDSSNTQVIVQTDAVFRDSSAWYHFMVRVNGTAGTIQFYVNGVEQAQTVSVGSLASNRSWDFLSHDSRRNFNVFSNSNGSNGTSALFAEFHYLDGLSYDPSYFGETKDGVWVPKDYSGSHGTNGFYLPFSKDSSSGASAFFSDSGNSYVEFSNATHYDIGSSDDFTIECFFNMTPTGVADYSYFLGKYQSSSDSFAIQYSSSANAFYFYYNDPSFNSFGFTFSSGDVVAGKWHHLAINRASGNLDAFLDGTRLGGNQTSNTTSWTAQSAFRIGLAQTNNSNGFDGYISNVRMVVGSAVYSSGSSITVPTSTLTAVTNTKLLALTTSTMTADASSNNVTGTLSGSGYFGTSGYSPFATFNFNDDQSGNSHIFSTDTLFPSDVVLDSPTNNFATMNPIYHSSRQATLTEGNLKVQNTQNFSNPGANSYGAVSTFAIPRDKKVYIEVQCDSHNGVYWYAGFATQSGLESGISNTYTGGASAVTFYNRAVMKNGTQFQYSSSSGVGGLGGGTNPFAINDVLGMAVDGSNGNVWFSKNGSYFKTIASNNGSTGNVGDPSAGTDPVATVDNVPDEDLFVVIGTGNPATVFVNFGQDSVNVSSANADSEGIGTFEYAVPTGYVSLCAANLTTDAIGPTESSQADDHFNTVLFTGDGSSSNAITGVGFQPDWVWIKSRNQAQGHLLTDSVRGATKRLQADAGSGGASKEDTSSGVTSFDSDGFTMGSSYNQSSYNQVSWNWKAGGAPTADNSAAANAEPTAGSAKIDGSNQSGAFSGSPSIAIKRLSASTTAGFSIVKWTGTGSAGTIPHGLGAAPEFYTVKNLTDDSTNWQSYHHKIASDAETDYIYLNDTAGADDSDDWNDTAPNANVFSVKTHNQVNASGDDYVAYLFTPIEGYSKFGSYIGNSDSDGTFVFTGFRPAWVLIKSTSSGTSWCIFDNKREGYNVDNDLLRVAAATEQTDDDVDFVSNGLKFRRSSTNFNNSSHTYIYLAFADDPFKFANAR